MDISMKIDKLETFEVEAKTRLGIIEGKSHKMESVSLTSLDDRLREETVAREKLEHRCRYLPQH